MTDAEFKELRDEILAEDPEAWEAVKRKAQWEHITLMAVIEEWGDPREWNKGGDGV